MDVVVLTVDQDASRSGPDRVPEALEALAPVPSLRAFERTAGDELQGILDDPTALPAALEPLLRTGGWNVGIGIGPVDTPLPQQARAGRGPARRLRRHARSARRRAARSACGTPGPGRSRARSRCRARA